MVDVTTDVLGQISQGSDILKGFQTEISNLSSIIGKLTNVLGGGENIIRNFTKQIEVAKKATDSISNSNKETKNTFQDLSVNFENLIGKTFKLIEGDQKLANVIGDTVLSVNMMNKGTIGLSDSVSAYAKNSQEATKAGLRFADSIKAINPTMGGVIENFTKIINEVKGFENAIMSAAQTGGNFYNTYNVGGRSMVDQNENVMNKVAKKAADTANILGIHFEDGLKLTLEVMAKLPGEFGKIYDDIIIGTKKYSMTTEQIIGRATRGIGVSTEKGLQIARDMLYTFGEDSIKTAERMSIISKASKELGVNFEDIDNLATDLDNTFGMWGNQLNGMVPILNDVSEALEGTNVGIKGQMNLVKNLGGAVSQLSLPMKSFVGIMSGMRSAGGAVGVGLNVERMIQEGRTGEIVGMLQETMQKMSGRSAVSLEEATEDPRAQRAFMVQRGMLQQMTGISDTGQLNRLLEVMSKTELGTGASIDAQNALSEAMKNGEDITTKQTDVMATVSENMKSLESTLVATNTLYREYIDKVTAKGEGRSIMDERTVSAAIAGQRDQSAKGSTFTQRDLTGEKVKTLMEETSVNMLKSYTTGFVNEVTVGGGIVKNSLLELSEGLKRTGNEDLKIFSDGITAVASKMEGFGEFFNAVKNSINNSDSYIKDNMPNTTNMLMNNQTPKVEFEPLKAELTVNISNDNDEIISKIYEIVLEAMGRISRGD